MLVKLATRDICVLILMQQPLKLKLFKQVAYTQIVDI